MKLLLEEDKIECPICHRRFDYINNFHLRTHGYNSEAEFHKDYPEYPLKTSEVQQNIKQHLNALNQDSELQSNKARQGWTPERREYFSKMMTDISHSLHTDDRYAETRLKIYKNRWGIRKKYTSPRSHKTYYLRSKLEWDIAYFLDSNSIDYEYESLQILYTRPDGTQHQYLPDFYLNKYNLVIEGKYSNEVQDEVVQCKKDAVLAKGYKFLFIDEKDIQNQDILIKKIAALDLE